MKSITVFLYVLCLTRKGANGLKFLEENVQIRSYYEDDLSQDPKNMAMSIILREIIREPLRDRSVTLILKEEEEEEEDLAESFLDADDLLKAIGSPVSILRLPGKPNNTNFTEEFTRSADGYDDNINSFPLKDSVVIFIMPTSSDLWWPLWSPPKEWVLRSAILISSSKSCLEGDESQMPLFERTTSLVIICPHVPQRATTSEIPFKVLTRKPFSAGNQLVDLGPWNPNFFKSWNNLFIDRFKDMTKKNMSIVCETDDRPLIYITPEGALKGVNYLIMDALRHWLNFDLKYTSYGTIKWTTMFDSIKKGENDVFINYATITPERNEDFDLTVPYYREGFAIVLEVPPPLPRWQNVLFPFSWPVWGAVVVSLFCTAITYHILHQRYDESFATNVIFITQFREELPKKHRLDPSGRFLQKPRAAVKASHEVPFIISKEKKTLTIGNLLTAAKVMSLLSNPMATIPTKWRVRNFLLMWMFGSWFLNMSYTCNLIAVLTIPMFPYKIQTAKELAESGYLLCMVDYGEFVDEALAASTDPTLSALSDKLEMVPYLDHMEHIGEEQCIDRVLASTHAHTETYSYVEILYNKLGHGAQVYSFREQLYPGYLAFLLQKNTPWKYKFDTGMQWMLETGLIQKWYIDTMNKFKGYKGDANSEIHALTLGHLQGPFLLYGIGLCLSLLVMAAEVLYPEEKTAQRWLS